MILVVDVVKGMQTQTAECLVIGEITCSKMMVVLNKVDLLPEATREASVQKMVKKMSMTLSKTRFKDAPIVHVSAKVGGSEDLTNNESIGMSDLTDTLSKMTFLPSRDPSGPFIFAVDHCFSIKGQGTIMTGTVLSGSVQVNENIEVAALKEVRKVKSIQIFRKPAQVAIQGDRAGICVTQFDSHQLGKKFTHDNLAEIKIKVFFTFYRKRLGQFTRTSPNGLWNRHETEQITLLQS